MGLFIPTHVNNLFNVKVDNVSSNGNINFGNTIAKGFTADAKAVGGQSIIGDLSPAFDVNGNLVFDPDVVDQFSSQF